MIVGIAGPSFCGSTIVDSMLGLLPGVQALGETHWIFDGSQDNPHATGYCLRHGVDCPRFPVSWLDEIRGLGEGRLYRAIEELVAPDVVVVADKGVHQWTRFGHPDMWIFPLKAPVALLHSYWKRGRGHGASIQRVKNEYMRLLQMSGGSPRRVVDLADLARRPEETMRCLATWLGVDYSPACLLPWISDSCHFGGNGAWRSQFHGEIRSPNVGWEGIYELLGTIPRVR